MSDNVLTLTNGNGGVPPEPDWEKFYNTDDKINAAHQHWVTIVNEMKAANTIAICNDDAIFRLITMRIEYRDAALDVALHGRLASPGRQAGKSPFNPNWTIMKQAFSAIKELEGDLGLSPRRRETAGKVKRGEKAKGKASDSYIKSA